MPRSSESSPGNRERINFTRVLQRVLPVCEGQWGVIAHWQLRQCEVSKSAISRWVTAGRLHRIYPGVYALGHRAIPAEGRLLAAVLYAGPGAALSHASAAHWWQLLPYLPVTTEVTSPRQRRSLEDVRVHRAQRIARVMHRGLPVTPIARTLLDFASVAPLERVRKAVAKADFHHGLDLEAIDALTGTGRRGSATLTRALSLHRPEYARTRSPLEDLLLDLCRRHRLPFPEVNVNVCGYEVDALWREQRAVVEVDGGDGHASYGQMVRDRQRELELRRAGYSVLRFSWRQVTSRAREVAADIRRALRARGAPAPRAGLSTP
jgi:very-short-patch-repair endonuclease